MDCRKHYQNNSWLRSLDASQRPIWLKKSVLELATVLGGALLNPLRAWMQRWRSLFACTLLAFCCVACTGPQLTTKEICPETMDIDGRRVCLNPKKWTGDYIPPDIRPLFVEAPGEVQVKSIAPQPWQKQAGKPYWVDNQRIIVAVDEYKGWTAGTDELSKVLIFNVDTGHVEETPYRGQVRCLSSEGALLLEDKPTRSTKYKDRKFGDTNPREEYFFKGQLGQFLTRYAVTSPSKEIWVINEYTCDHYSNSIDKNPPGNPLRKNDGFIASADSYHREYHTRLLDESGKVVYIFKELSLCEELYLPVYLPWLKKYYSFTPVGNIKGGYCPDGSKYSWLISANGVEIKELPHLIQAATTFGHGLAGTGRNYWAKRGQYVVVYERNKLLGGLYWQDEKTGLTKRVLKQEFRLDILSPNGCRALYGTEVIDLCHQE